MYQDKTLTCRDCGAEFIFSANEQEFYASKGFENEPARCPSCRAARKQQRSGRGSDRRPREMFKTTCAKCGGEAEVPFRPSSDRPVYCKECFQDSKSRW
ncbi:MAG: zinc-ribbon domain containing protein [Syntrophaceticus sp.]|jgi:CxxC-x17-CxxC domain-containing protein